MNLRFPLEFVENETVVMEITGWSLGYYKHSPKGTLLSLR